MTGSVDFSRMLTYFQFRRIHWIIIVCCFFLPAMRGCQNEVVIPVLDVMDSPSWITYLIYLYPLLLPIGALLIKKLIAPKFQFGVLFGLLYIFGIALSVLFVAVMKDTILGRTFVYGGSLAVIWGAFYLGLSRSKSAAHLLELAAFALSSISLWFFPISLISAQDILIGGWIFMYAAGVVVLSYPMQFLRHANH